MRGVLPDQGPGPDCSGAPARRRLRGLRPMRDGVSHGGPERSRVCTAAAGRPCGPRANPGRDAQGACRRRLLEGPGRRLTGGSASGPLPRRSFGPLAVGAGRRGPGSADPVAGPRLLSPLPHWRTRASGAQGACADAGAPGRDGCAGRSPSRLGGATVAPDGDAPGPRGAPTGGAGQPPGPVRWAARRHSGAGIRNGNCAGAGCAAGSGRTPQAASLRRPCAPRALAARAATPVPEARGERAVWGP